MTSILTYLLPCIVCNETTPHEAAWLSSARCVKCGTLRGYADPPSWPLGEA